MIQNLCLYVRFPLTSRFLFQIKMPSPTAQTDSNYNFEILHTNKKKYAIMILSARENDIRSGT